jgi:PHD/YefM family antitoxin component YafN of YafNO toxin-antitoxin module
MTIQLQEPSYVDEPQEAKDYADVISRVSTEHRAVIVRRDGADMAVIIPLEYLEPLRETLAMAEVQRLLGSMDLARMAKENPPPQSWFDREEPKPF